MKIYKVSKYVTLPNYSTVNQNAEITYNFVIKKWFTEIERLKSIVYMYEKLTYFCSVQVQNLLPLQPLDGAKVNSVFTSYRWVMQLLKVQFL